VLQHRNLVALKADVAFLGCNGADPSVLANLRAEGLKVATADPGTG